MAYTVVECPVCGDRKLVDYNDDHLPPSVWCAHPDKDDAFVLMETVT